MTQPLVLKDFDTAVADSPSKGHALMRNIDIESFPGHMKVSKKLLPMTNLITTRTFVANTGGVPADAAIASGSLISQAMTDDGARNYNLAAVTVSTTGTLPSYNFGGGGAPLVAGTVYYIGYNSNSQFYLYDTLAHAISGFGNQGSPTADGTGVHTITAVPMGTINHIRKDPSTGYYYAQDSNGRIWGTIQGSNVYYLITGNTLTASAGNGLELFKVSDGSAAYLFSFRNAAIDVMNLSTRAWTNSWQTLNSGSGSGNSHEAIVGQDNIIYFPDDRYVGSIQEKAGSVFAPGSSGTYTYNNQSLTLPQNEIAQCLAEQGVNLLVGGLIFNKIYPWDRSSASFNLPIAVPEQKIYKMRNSGGLVYVLAGTKGNIYTTQGTYAKLFKKLPIYLANNGTTVSSTPVTWGGLALRTGAILVGASVISSGNSGVYLIYPDGKLVQDNTPYGGSQQVTAIYADNDFYYIGYAGGADYNSTALYADSTFTSVYQSGLYRVASKTGKATYSTLEVKIAKPASTGQIRASYRTDESSAFTTITTFSADGVKTSFEYDAGLTNIENIQVQFEFDANIELVEATLFP